MRLFVKYLHVNLINSVVNSLLTDDDDDDENSSSCRETNFI